MPKLAQIFLKKANKNGLCGSICFLMAHVFALSYSFFLHQGNYLPWNTFFVQNSFETDLNIPEYPLFAENTLSSTIEKTFSVASLQNLRHQLLKNGLSTNEIKGVLKQALSSKAICRRLKIEQNAHLVVSKTAGSVYFKSLSIKIDRTQCLKIFKNGSRYVAKLSKEPLIYSFRRIQGVVHQTILSALTSQGVPLQEAQAILKSFTLAGLNWRLDFQKGDRFSILCRQSKLMTEKKPLFDSLFMVRIEKKNNATLTAYRYQPKGQSTPSFYTKEGLSCFKSALLRPIGKARLSSKFGMRKHPVYHCMKFHSGVDWAAPEGTPIRAAASGKIEFAGWRGGYGKYIRIRHNKIYSTAYGHLRRYAPCSKNGSFVQQGQIIGYVGSTGTAKGAHLHFEVLRHQKAINPLSIAGFSPEKLSGSVLSQFKKHVQHLGFIYAKSKSYDYMVTSSSKGF